jgi:Secretion system C-terminal sorting domain
MLTLSVSNTPHFGEPTMRGKTTVLALILTLSLSLTCFAIPGDLIWDHQLGGEEAAAFGDLVQLSNGDILAFGWSGTYTDFLSEFYAAKFTTDGTQLWATNFPDVVEQTGFAVAPTDDGGAILVGSSFVWTGGNSNVIMKRIDGDGNIVWENSWDGGHVEVANAIIPGHDGMFAICGYVLSTTGGNDEMMLLYMDGTDGSIEFSNTYSADGDDWHAMDVVYDRSNKYTLIGFATPEGGHSSVRTISVDLNGVDSDWTSYDQGFPMEPYAATLTDDGKLYLAGHCDPPNDGTYRGLIYMQSADEEWHTIYGEYSTHFDDIKLVGDALIVNGNHMDATFDFSAYTLAVDVNDAEAIIWEHEYNSGAGYDNGTAIVPLFTGEILTTGQTYTADSSYNGFVEQIEGSALDPSLDAIAWQEGMTFEAGQDGIFPWDLVISNPLNSQVNVYVRTGVTTPDDELLRLQNRAVTIPAQTQIFVENLEQEIPPTAPLGEYRYHVAMFHSGDLISLDQMGFSVVAGVAPATAPEQELNAALWPLQGWTFTASATPSAPASSTTDEFELYSVYPNPFNASTTISVQVPQDGRLRISLFDVLGREAIRIHDGVMTGGIHTFTVDASTLASGVYFIRASLSGHQQMVEKITLMR